MFNRRWIGSVVLIVAVVATGTALAAWKHASLEKAGAATASQPEPVESVQMALAKEREHRPVTTAIGTVVATRSISVRNELPGTVRRVALVPGQIVAQGTVLVGLDVSVESAELQALEAQAALAETQFARVVQLSKQRAVSTEEVDSTRAARDVALAQIARVKATIERKTIRAPFRARVGISDVHPGQYLSEGTFLTSLQGVDESAYVDFAVAQHVAAGLRSGDTVQLAGADAHPVAATIMAVDSRIDPATRNASVRATIPDASIAPPPGASVRVQVPAGIARLAVTIPASALRKGPEGDYVFIVARDKDGKERAQFRQVRVETMAGDEVVLREGVTAGEQVAASGSFKLRDAVLVSVIQKPESVAANTAAAGDAGVKL
ncbi:MAG: efflux RND transporter periplasmic adaptor subunit [Steroidobacteraceae bacterium]